MYAKVYFNEDTRYSGQGVVGAALSIQILDTINDIDTVIDEKTIKVVRANSSQAVLELMIKVMRMIPNGFLTRIDYVEKKSNKMNYFSTVICRMNKWIQNDYHDANGEVLKNKARIERFNEVWESQLVEFKDGRKSKLPIVLEEQKVSAVGSKKKTEDEKKFSELKAIAKLAASEDYHRMIKANNLGSEFKFNKIQEENRA